MPKMRHTDSEKTRVANVQTLSREGDGSFDSGLFHEGNYSTDAGSPSPELELERQCRIDDAEFSYVADPERILRAMIEAYKDLQTLQNCLPMQSKWRNFAREATQRARDILKGE